MTSQKPKSPSTPASSKASPKGRRDVRLASPPSLRSPRSRERIEERAGPSQGNRDFRKRTQPGGKPPGNEKNGGPNNAPRGAPQLQMGSTAAQPGILLKAGREKSLLRRHPWIFSGAIERVDGAPASGDTLP
ncbi:MAG TPA: hypothetical protein VLS47_01550, partial [Gallionella sp.]|nr:hypothetical protein [Gallionella sp.]